MAFVALPEHVDDLEPYWRQHRLLGLGLFMGGAAGGLVLAATILSPRLGLGAWAAALLAGAAHMTVGAAWLQRRMARRMLDAGR